MIQSIGDSFQSCICYMTLFRLSDWLNVTPLYGLHIPRPSKNYIPIDVRLACILFRKYSLNGAFYIFCISFSCVWYSNNAIWRKRFWTSLVYLSTSFSSSFSIFSWHCWNIISSMNKECNCNHRWFFKKRASQRENRDVAFPKLKSGLVWYNLRR